jgi:hypothetical protein
MSSSPAQSGALEAAISWLRRAGHRVREVWAELDYAQRRLLDIQSGQSLIKPERRPGIASRVDQLEALYEYESFGVEIRP